MARQPETEDGIALDVSGMPGSMEPPVDDPQVGDIYKPRAGQPGYWWIIGITCGEFHHTCHYVVFNLRGQIVGTSRASVSYLRERNKVGHAEIPPIVPEWY